MLEVVKDVANAPDKSKPWCIKNTTTGNRVGGWFADKKSAEDQAQAIESKTKKNSLLVPVKAFADAVASPGAANGDNLVWIQAYPYKTWTHPMFSDTTIDAGVAERMVANFKNNTYGQEVPSDYEHGLDPSKGTKASGWIKDVQARDDGLYVGVKFTETATKEIRDGEWKYWSTEHFDEWTNPVTGEKHDYVLSGGALTNKPWVKGMAPINFSELITTRKLGEQWLVSEDDGNTWRDATKDEVAELEHSEPGQGSPPPPRTDEDDRSGDKDGSGSRRETPPNTNEEGSEVKLKVETLKLLGLSETSTDEEVERELVKMHSEVKPLRDAAANANQAKTFAEQFPQEHARMQALEASERENSSKMFTERYTRLLEASKEDPNNIEKAVRGTKGFSALALDMIRKAHKKFSEGTVTATDFQAVLDAITAPKGIVDYGESGSSVVPVIETSTDPAKAFAEKVMEIQSEAGGSSKMSWGDAISAATTKFPELAKAYSERSVPNA